MKRRRFGLSFVTAVAVALVLASTTSAAQPTNDPFAGATTLPGLLPQQTVGTNVEATKEAGEPEHAGDPGGHSVWYRWTAPANLKVEAETCGSATNFATLLAVYVGAEVGALAEVASSDHRCANASFLSFTATQGTTYYIAVDGFNGEAGSFVLKLTGFIAAFTVQSSLTAADPTQTGRLFRNGRISSCGEPNVVEPHDATPGRIYKTFPIVSLITEATCMDIETVAPGCQEDKTIQSAVYDAFDPSQLAANLVTADGSNPSPADSYDVSIAAGKSRTLAVNMVELGRECPAFTVNFQADRPWATTRPRVLMGNTDAIGRDIPAGLALAASPAAWGSTVKNAFQWQSCDAAGDGCANIAGATAETLKPKFAQVGHTLRLIDTAADPAIASTSSIASAATGVVKPSNAIKLSKFKANKKKGTGLLTVLVPGAGKLTLTGKGVKKSKGKSKNEGKVVLKVGASGKAKATLLATGKASVKVKVKFVPTGGKAGTASRKLTLKKAK